ncbi:transcription elongation factor GreA [Spirochaetota bacterium]|nr:transcription elongation factor GreA [Spirochaetota bacterium]
MNVTPITQKGYDKLRSKLTDLNNELKELPKIIGAAREKGDLKENAEYHAAREKQGLLNAHITKINSDLARARVIDPKALPQDTVTFGKVVTLTDLASQEIQTYHIVGPAETEFFKHGLSMHSELAKALLAKKKGDQITVIVPSGKNQYKIEEVSVI